MARIGATILRIPSPPSGIPSPSLDGMKIRLLENRVERAALALEALWTIVRDKYGITEKEFIDRVNQLDLTDGTLDGQIRRAPVTCPKCKESLSPHFLHCPYCATAVKLDPFA